MASHHRDVSKEMIWLPRAMSRKMIAAHQLTSNCGKEPSSVILLMMMLLNNNNEVSQSKTNTNMQFNNLIEYLSYLEMVSYI